jgi:hypothetical protein
LFSRCATSAKSEIIPKPNALRRSLSAAKFAVRRNKKEHSFAMTHLKTTRLENIFYIYVKALLGRACRSR